MTPSRAWKDWALAAEALLLLAVFRMWLAVTPVRRILGAMTSEQIGAEDTSHLGAAPRAERDLEVARRVEWAVSAAAHHSPIEFVCFPQTLAGYTMLRRRGVGASIVYGVMRSQDGELLAHTWLMVGGKVVTGADGMPGYTAIERWR